MARLCAAEPKPFGELLSVGIVTNMFFYVLIDYCNDYEIDLGVGVRLPLISCGGTAMLPQCSVSVC